MNFKKADVEFQNIAILYRKTLSWNGKNETGVFTWCLQNPVYGMCGSFRILVTYYTPEDGLVLDNFMGRGTNVLAFYGMVEE